jgi:hypothetical protein
VKGGDAETFTFAKGSGLEFVCQPKGETLMSKGLCVLFCLALLAIPATVLGWSFDYEVFAFYSGTITSGGVGIVQIWWDDSLWPTDPDERFDSLWAWYFADNYVVQESPDPSKWVGTIPGWVYISASSAPVGYNGSCVCYIIARITVKDWNWNGVLDTWELKTKQHLFNGNLSKLCDYYDDGEMMGTMGSGSISSNYFSFYPPDPPNVDTLYSVGVPAQLNIFPFCPVSVEQSSWGAIKALYK